MSCQRELDDLTMLRLTRQGSEEEEEGFRLPDRRNLGRLSDEHVELVPVVPPMLQLTDTPCYWYTVLASTC